VSAGAGFEVSPFASAVISSSRAVEDGVADAAAPPSIVAPDGALTADVDGAPDAPDVPVAADPPGCGAFVRSLKQYRHLIASSWISSAQYGHFFTLASGVRGRGQLTRPGLGASALD
jgi:hypothetical protein